MKNRIASILALAMLWSGQSLGQSEAPANDTDTEVSKEIENPVTRRITLPLRYEADFLDGAYKATKDTFQIDQAIGLPFMPLSVAGVARHTTRRGAWYGAAAAAAAPYYYPPQWVPAPLLSVSLSLSSSLMKDNLT